MLPLLFMHTFQKSDSIEPNNEIIKVNYENFNLKEQELIEEAYIITDLIEKVSTNKDLSEDDSNKFSKAIFTYFRRSIRLKCGVLVEVLPSHRFGQGGQPAAGSFLPAAFYRDHRGPAAPVCFHSVPEYALPV